MNIRKSIDYADMYTALDIAMGKDFAQVELYYEIGKAVCRRTEKGAAVAAAVYLSKQYPDVQGFSPRNLRRMRDFYRTYENYPDLLAEALEIGWTQNVVIMEADLTVEVREWYLRAAKQFGWSKAELIDKIQENADEAFALMRYEEKHHTSDSVEVTGQIKVYRFSSLVKNLWHLMRTVKSCMEFLDERQLYTKPLYGVPAPMRC